MKKIYFFIAAIVAFPQLLSAQIDYTITKDSVGNDHTLLRLEHQNGRYAEYMLEGNPDDISASFVDYINQDPLFENTTDDQLVATITLPAADLGFTPIEFCNVGDKIYCFGGNAVFSVDPSTSNITNVIPLSNAGSFFIQTVLQDIPANRFIMGDASQNRLFVADLSNNFYVINTLTDQVIATHTLAAFTEQQSTCIGYNSDDDIVYWMVNSWADGTVINSYNALTGAALQTASFAFQINDMLFSNGAIFVLTNHPGLKKIDKSSLQVLNSLVSAGGFYNIVDMPNDRIAVHAVHQAGNDIIIIYSTIDLSISQTIASSQSNPDLPMKSHLYNNTYDAIVAVFYDALLGHNIVETFKADAQGVYQTDDYFWIIYNRPISNLAQKPNNNYVFLSGENYLNRYNLANYTLLPVPGTIQSCTSKDLIVAEITGIDYVYSANALEGSYSKHSSTTTVLDDINQTAFKTNIGCYNIQNDKLYFLNNRIKYENSGLAIVNATNNSVIDIVPLGAYLTDVVYNKNTNRVFVSSPKEQEVYVIDGQTNSLISSISILDKPTKLYSKGGKVYCGGSNYLNVIDASTLTCSPLQLVSSGSGSCVRFEHNNTADRLYVLHNAQYPQVAEIDLITNTLLNVHILTQLPCDDIKYNPIENEIYLGSSNHKKVFVYDASNFSFITEIELPTGLGNTIDGMDLEFDIYKNKLYVFADPDGSRQGGFVSAINCVDHSVISNKYSGSPEDAISYNPINDQVYYYNNFINGDNRLEEYFSVDDCLDDMTEAQLSAGNLLSRNYNLNYQYDFIEEVFIPSTNMLYMPNGAFSNVSVIQCHNDYFEVEAGWNWLSFPRMERYLDGDFDSEAELSYLSVFPERYLKMHYKFPYLATYYKQFDPNGVPQWSGSLGDLNSTKGYKLRIGGSDDPMYTHLKGGKLEPETYMDLYESEPENWVGYFVEYPQLPQDCFSPATWDALTSVVTRYWSIYKVEPSGGGTYWLGSGEVTPFEYGDLVILTVDDDHAFSWVESDNHTEALGLPETAYYEFEEQASYLPYYIEFDSIADAQEVAILADNDVVGAAVRQSGDTLIEVNAYLEGVSPDAEISVETWSGMKSSVADIEYSVFNQKTHRYENRTAVAGETTRYQLISLKKSVVETAPKPLPAEVTCFPNPFSDQVNFRIEMSVDASVRLEIRDVNGRLLAFVSEGKLNKGKHVLSWEGNTLSGESLSQGMYYYNLFIDEQLCTSGKLIKH